MRSPASGELPKAAVDYVAGQVKVEAGDAIP